MSSLIGDAAILEIWQSIGNINNLRENKRTRLMNENKMASPAKKDELNRHPDETGQSYPLELPATKVNTIQQ